MSTELMRSLRGIRRTIFSGLLGFAISILTAPGALRAFPEKEPGCSSAPVSLSPNRLSRIWNHAIWDLCEWSQVISKFGINRFASANANRKGSSIGPGCDQVYSIPFSFVENRGQWQAPSRFVAHRPDYRVHLSTTAVTLQVIGEKNAKHQTVHNLAFEFEGANTNVVPRGTDKQSGKFNYFRGRKQSHQNVAAYGKVHYPSLWDGVDLWFRENSGILEYDLVLSPGADLSKVVIRGRGIDRFEISQSGDLWVRTPVGNLYQKRPTTWYELPNGERRPIACEYVIIDKNRYSFKIPNRNQDWKVIIDPGLVWSTYVGGINDDHAYDLLMTPSGAIILLGETDSDDFPITPGAVKTTLSGFSDLVVSSLYADGSKLLFSTFIGGNRRDTPRSISLDSLGNFMIVGESNSDDLPVTAGAFNTLRSGGIDGFLAQLSPDGANLLYLSYFGGSDDDRILATDNAAGDDLVVVGETYSNDFPTTVGAFNPSANGARDGFVCRLDPSGNGASDMVFSTYLGSPMYDTVNAVVVDSSDRAVVGGTTHSSAFPTTAGAFKTTFSGKGDAFITRLTVNGAALSYSSFLGSAGFESVDALEFDSSDNLVVAGITTGFDFPATPGTFQTNLDGSNDIYLANMSLIGTGATDLNWCTFLGGSNIEYVYDIALDSTDQITLVGQTRSADFDVTLVEGIEPVAMDEWDGFLTRFSADGSTLLHSNYVASDGWEVVWTLAQDGLELVALAGETTPSPNFETTPGTLNTVSSGGVYELFVRLISIEQDISLELSPIDATVSVGSVLRFNIFASNNTALTQAIVAELRLYNPDGSSNIANPILGPKSKNLPPNLMVNRLGRYRIPAGSPTGTYTIRGEIIRGSETLTLSSIVFEVVE